MAVGVAAAVLWAAGWAGNANYRRVMTDGCATLVVEPSGRVTFGGAEVVAAVAVRVVPREVTNGEGGTATHYGVVVATSGGAVAIRAVSSWAVLGLAYTA